MTIQSGTEFSCGSRNFPLPKGMAKNRKPSPSSAQPPPIAGDDDLVPGDFPEFAPGELPDTSPSARAPSAADSDITLEDHEDRHVQRPRLPEQRREVKSFEMSASVAPVRESPAYGQQETAESAESSTEAAPATPDEIATYDPLAAELTAPASAASAPLSKPAPKPAAAFPSTPGLDDLDEFIARTVSEGPAKEKVEKVRRPFTLVEKICSLAGAAILISAAVWLITSATGAANGVKQASTPWPDLPMEGSLVTITEASSTWRMRAATDRVAQMEIILPVPGQQMPAIIPQVHFTIDTSKSTNGFLRFIFKDTGGKPQGDTRVIQVENGKLKDMGKGEIIKGSAEGSIYGSYGLLNTAEYRSYEGDDKPRWSVEVSESASYDADDKDWKILGTFNVRNDLAE